MSFSGVSAEPSVMRLAHPVRCAAMGSDFLEVLPQLVGKHTWDALTRAMRDSTRMTGGVIRSLANEPQHSALRRFIEMTSGLPGGSELGNAYAALCMVRHHVATQPYLVIDDALLTLLEHTDLAEDIPVGALQLPYSRCFIEFGRSRTVSARVPNDLSGLHVLEGAYCEQGVNPDFGPGLFVMFTGSPLEKLNAGDDATYGVFLGLDEPERSLTQALAVSFERSVALGRTQGLIPVKAEHQPAMLECLLLLAKVLLYLALPEARRIERPERSEALRALKAKKSGAKRARLERKARHLTDHVLVCAAFAPEPPAVNAEGASRLLRTHFRRGHYRMQPFGPQRTQRKLIFLRPTLVRGVGEAPALPRYEVR